MNKVGASVLAMVFAVSAVSATTASAATLEELQALIAQLTAQIAALSSSSTTTTTTTEYIHTGVEKDFTFKVLTVGSKGEEVKALQKVINTGVDGNFGPGTKKALMA
jgi:tellurite resistance protein